VLLFAKKNRMTVLLVRACLEVAQFLKIWFLVMVSRIWFLGKKLDGGVWILVFIMASEI
jgi:hypothetical protein